MKKLIIISIIVLGSITMFAQGPVQTLRVPNATTAFGINIPVGYSIINMADTSEYICHTATSSSLTLTTGAANFKKIGSGNSHNAVTLGTANGLSLNAQVLSLGTSSTSTTGALTSTDWNTFNNKQNAFTSKVQHFTESATGSQGEAHTLAGSPSGEVLVEMNGFPLTTSQFTIVGTTFTITIPVYQYDRVAVIYKY